MAPQIQRVLSLPVAAARMGISVRALTRLIRNGKMRAVQLPTGEMAVGETDVKRTTRKTDLQEYRQYSHLSNERIGIGEAARKYEVATSTVHQWVQKGYIARVGQVGQKVLLNEQDVAYCVHIYREYGSHPRRRLFNDDGTPYIAKTRVAAE